MKKLFLVVVVVAASITTGKAQFYIGGSFGFWYDNTTPKTTSFNIAPDAGYSFNNRWAVGMAIGFDARIYHDKTQNWVYINPDGSSSSYISTYSNDYYFYAEPYARFNYFSVDRIKLFLDGVLGVAVAEHGSFGGFQVIVRPGISINLTDHFTLVGTFGRLGCSFGGYRNSADGFGFWLRNSFGLSFYYSF